MYSEQLLHLFFSLDGSNASVKLGHSVAARSDNLFCFFNMAFLKSHCLAPKYIWHFMFVGCYNAANESKVGTEWGMAFSKRLI